MKHEPIHRTRNRTCGLGALAFTGCLLLAGAAAGDIIEIESDEDASTEGLGSFAGTLEYANDVFGGSGTLIVSLTNTSDADNGGKITGFVFNIDSSDANAAASLTAASHDFDEIANANAAPFGTFDAGAALGGNWLGGGSPNGGIGVGQSGSFSFDVTASDASSLLAENFLSGSSGHDFAVRFKGFDDGGSDKVPGGPGASIPAPAAMALLMIAGVSGTRRRRRT